MTEVEIKHLLLKFIPYDTLNLELIFIRILSICKRMYIKLIVQIMHSFNEGKELYLQYDNLEAGKIHERLGFKSLD